MLAKRQLPSFPREWRLSLHDLSKVDGADAASWAPLKRYQPLRRGPNHLKNMTGGKHAALTVVENVLRRSRDERSRDNGSSFCLALPYPKSTNCLGALQISSHGLAQCFFAVTSPSDAVDPHPGRCRIHERQPSRPDDLGTKFEELALLLTKRMSEARGILDTQLARLARSSQQSAQQSAEPSSSSTSTLSLRKLGRSVFALLEDGLMEEAEAQAIQWVRMRTDQEYQRWELVRSGGVAAWDKIPFAREDHLMAPWTPNAFNSADNIYGSRGELLPSKASIRIRALPLFAVHYLGDG